MAVSKEDFALADKINQQVELKQSELRNLKYQHPLLDHRVRMINIYQLIMICNLINNYCLIFEESYRYDS